MYATDSLSPVIYRVAQGDDKILPFLSGEPFLNLQGIALAPGGDRLFVADYAQGIFAIDLRTKKVTKMSTRPNTVLLGIDGLYAVGQTLVAVQNGITPNRVIRLSLGEDHSSIAWTEVLEANNPMFDEPALGVVVGGSLYFVANSQWRLVDEKGSQAAPEELQDAVILKLPL